jgi:hypothetical protein
MSAHFERPRRVDMRSSFTQSYQVKLAPINLHRPDTGLADNARDIRVDGLHRFLSILSSRRVRRSEENASSPESSQGVGAWPQ